MSAFGNTLSIRMSLLLGKGPVVGPAPLNAMESIEEVEVRQSMIGDSGFKLSLYAGRDGLLGPPFVDDSRFQRNARIVVTMWNGVKQTPIFDGIITKTQYIPGSGENEGRYIMLGRDLTWLMDREQKRVQHPAQDESTIVKVIAAAYATYGIRPAGKSPMVNVPPNLVDRVPQQTGTDLAYLRTMACRHGYKVFIDPGPAPGFSQLYFGPVPLPGLPQKPISVNLGPMSDAFDVNIEHNGETLTAARAKVQDRATGQVAELQIATSTNKPQSLLAEALTQVGNTKIKELTTSGLNTAQVLARLIAEVNSTAEKVLKVTGTIDNTRYNAILKPFHSVQIRGLGKIYNGVYTVAEVRHIIKPGSYTQTFTLHGDGLYSIENLVTQEVAAI